MKARVSPTWRLGVGAESAWRGLGPGRAARADHFASLRGPAGLGHQGASLMRMDRCHALPCTAMRLAECWTPAGPMDPMRRRALLALLALRGPKGAGLRAVAPQWLYSGRPRTSRRGILPASGQASSAMQRHQPAGRAHPEGPARPEGGGLAASRPVQAGDGTGRELADGSSRSRPAGVSQSACAGRGGEGRGGVLRSPRRYCCADWPLFRPRAYTTTRHGGAPRARRAQSHTPRRTTARTSGPRHAVPGGATRAYVDYEPLPRHACTVFALRIKTGQRMVRPSSRPATPRSSFGSARLVEPDGDFSA